MMGREPEVTEASDDSRLPSKSTITQTKTSKNSPRTTTSASRTAKKRKSKMI